MTEMHFERISWLLEKYSFALTPFHLCPPLLFVEQIRINRLRYLATVSNSNAEALSEEAYKILERIHTVSIQEWVDLKPSSTKDWTLMGNIYQAAVALFAILSLQSIFILPNDAVLQNLRMACSRRLQCLIKTGLASPEINRFMLWPLVILGVQAVQDGTMRSYVQTQLEDLSYKIGTYAPMTAKHVLEAFWSSGETSWDACFDRPYAFTMQIAVDVSRIAPTW